jgi:hypothetical protein
VTIALVVPLSALLVNNACYCERPECASFIH